MIATLREATTLREAATLRERLRRTRLRVYVPLRYTRNDISQVIYRT
ncbi:hypothetical protein [Calothrix sp. NIES-2098]